MQSTKCRNSATHQSAPDSARDELELFPAAAEAKEAGAIVVVLREKVLWGGLGLSRARIRDAECGNTICIASTVGGVGVKLAGAVS